MTFDPGSIVSPQQAGQPVDPSAPEAQEQGNGTPQTPGLTIEQVTQAIQAAMEKYGRAEQSKRDKFESRLTQSVEKQIATLKAAGVDVTDDLKTSLTTATRKELESAADAAPSPEQPAQAKPAGGQPQADADPNQPYYSIAGEILKKAGVTINEDDPEAAELQAFEGTPFDWLEKVRELAEAKKARISKSPASTTTTGIDGATPGNRWSGMDPLDILSQAYKK